jgi:hypothetical protein
LITDFAVDYVTDHLKKIRADQTTVGRLLRSNDVTEKIASVTHAAQ